MVLTPTVIKIEKALQGPQFTVYMQTKSTAVVSLLCSHFSEWRSLVNMSQKPGCPSSASTLLSPGPATAKACVFHFPSIQGLCAAATTLVQQPPPAGTTDSASESTPALSGTFSHQSGSSSSTNLISRYLFHRHTPLVSARQRKALAAQECVSGPLAAPRPWPRALFMALPHLQGCVPTHRPCLFQLANSDLTLQTSALLTFIAFVSLQLEFRFGKICASQHLT